MGVQLGPSALATSFRSFSSGLRPSSSHHWGSSFHLESLRAFILYLIKLPSLSPLEWVPTHPYLTLFEKFEFRTWKNFSKIWSNLLLKPKFSKVEAFLLQKSKFQKLKQICFRFRIFETLSKFASCFEKPKLEACFEKSKLEATLLRVSKIQNLKQICLRFQNSKRKAKMWSRSMLLLRIHNRIQLIPPQNFPQYTKFAFKLFYGLPLMVRDG